MKMRLFAGAAAALCCAGLAMAQPANDLCTGAIPLTAGVAVTGNNSTATSTGDGPAATCQSSSGKGVWYTFSPAATGQFIVSACGSIQDTVLQIYTTPDCTTFTAVACDDDSCAGGEAGLCTGTTSGLASVITGVTLTGGTTYYIRLSSFGSAPAGNCYTLQVSTFVGGACCSGTGTCTVTQQTACTGTSTFVGANTTCTPTNPCTALLGACCNNTTGVCSSTTNNGCSTTTSTFQGAGTACTPQPGPCLGAGACCTSSGSCSITAAGGCTATTSFFVGVGTVCSPTNACTALLGACCSTTGSCSTTIQQGCTGTSTFSGAGTTCTPTNPCGGACCNGTTCTVTVSATACTTGVFTAGALCSPNSCSGACCSSTGVCTVTGPAACTGTFIASVTCTPTPGPCVQSGGPANDLCANAIMISSASLPATADGNNTLASTDPMPAVCASSQKDVWYTFTPMVSQNYSVRTCGGLTGTLDTVVSVHTACPTVFVNNLLTGACNDDGCSGIGASQISSIALNAGTTYWIRVARFGTTSGNAGGPFTLTIDQITGTCCNPTTGVCSITTQAACGAGTWVLGGVCTTSTCAGACCNTSTGACTTSTDTGCAAGSNYSGAGTTCSPNACPQFSGGCCATDGTCSIDSPLNCVAPRVYIGNGSTCDGAVGCPATGSCCSSTGSCSVGFQASCTGTTVWTAGGTCTPSPCVVGACCNGTTCTTVISVACTGDYLGNNTVCDASSCVLGACCIASTSTCIQTNATLCANQNGTFSGPGTLCSTATVGNTLFSSGTTFPVAIADNSTSTATIVIPAGSGTVSGLNVSVGLSHTFVGDLTVTISNGTTTVDLIAAAITAGSDLGGQYVFSDSAPTTFASAVGGASVAPGVYKPGSPLSVFDGAPFEGTWTLSVTDSATLDTGTIDALSYVTVQVTPTCVFSGACCCGSTCSLTLAAACTGTNTVFRGSGTACNAAGNNLTPCCKADYNQSGAVSVQDIFDFLAGYFSADACADINGTGIPPTVQDIFDFLAAYFAGCA